MYLAYEIVIIHGITARRYLCRFSGIGWIGGRSQVGHTVYTSVVHYLSRRDFYTHSLESNNNTNGNNKRRKTHEKCEEISAAFINQIRKKALLALRGSRASIICRAIFPPGSRAISASFFFILFDFLIYFFTTCESNPRLSPHLRTHTIGVLERRDFGGGGSIRLTFFHHHHHHHNRLNK